MGRAASRGYAILTSLAFLVILGVLAYAFQSGMQLNSTLATRDLLDEQARSLAAGGIAEARAALAAGLDPAPLAQVHAVRGGQVAVRAEDMRGKLHLNQAPVDELAALLRVEAATIAAARPFATVHDTYAALGLSPDQYQTARAHTTVHGDGRLNLDAAPVAVLSALGSLSQSQAEAVARHRAGADGEVGTGDDRRVNSAKGLAAVPGLDKGTVAQLTPRLGTDAAWYRVVAQGRSGRRIARVEAVLHRGPGGWQPVAWIDRASAS